MNIAKTILDQLTYGQENKMRFWSWGAHALTNLNDEALAFKVNGAKFRGTVIIKYLEGADLYQIRFLNLRMREVKKIEQVYFDDLNNLIDEFVEKQENYSY